MTCYVCLKQRATSRLPIGATSYPVCDACLNMVEHFSSAALQCEQCGRARQTATIRYNDAAWWLCDGCCAAVVASAGALKTESATILF